MKKLTRYQKLILTNLSQERHRFYGIYGLSQKGAAGRVYFAMYDRGWIDFGHHGGRDHLTALGREVLEAGGHDPS